MTFLAVNGTTSPTIEVSLDWQNDPTSMTTTWTDITPYVVSYSRAPVRTNEFDQPGPAGATILLRNDDARFIPDNTAGPYFGGLKKYRRMRVRAQWAGVTYNRYFGYVLDWPQSWDDAGLNQSVTIQLSDALTPLETADLAINGANLVGTWGATMLSGTAISKILTLAGAQNSSGTLDTGLSTVTPLGTTVYTPGGAQPPLNQFFALRILQDVSASENGVCFADGAGLIQFHDRKHRAAATLAATIGDGGPGEIPYVDPRPLYGDVWPNVVITPYGGTALSATNAAASASYFNRTLSYPPAGQYLVASTTEAGYAAAYLVDRYSNPVTRIDAVTVIGAAQTSSWPTILSLDTSTKIVFKRRFLNRGITAGTITLSEFVEGYGDEVTVGQDWRVPLALSPAAIQTYWVLGTSALNTDTRLFY